MGSYVGIDLHRRRSAIVVLNDDGDRLSWSRIDNNSDAKGDQRRCHDTERASPCSRLTEPSSIRSPKTGRWTRHDARAES
jgi:hypothetical protein